MFSQGSGTGSDETPEDFVKSSAACLQPSSVLVEFAFFYDDADAQAVAAFLLRPDASVRLLPLGLASEIKKLPTIYRKVIRKSEDAALSKERLQAGRELRAKLLNPALAAVGSATHLFFALDGFLFKIPFVALPLDPGGQLAVRVGLGLRHQLPRSRAGLAPAGWAAGAQCARSAQAGAPAPPGGQTGLWRRSGRHSPGAALGAGVRRPSLGQEGGREDPRYRGGDQGLERKDGAPDGRSSYQRGLPVPHRRALAGALAIRKHLRAMAPCEVS